MRMAADKQLRRLSVYFTLYKRTVPAGITADMRHPDIYVFTIKSQVFGKNLADILAVNIAINTFQRFKSSESINYLHTAEIAGMPDLVAVFEMFKNRIIEVAVGVGKEPYFNHCTPNTVITI